KTSRQVLFIALIVSVAGFASNMLRSDKLPLFDDWSAKSNLVTSSGENLEISLADASKLFMEKRSVFIDARSKEEYEKGHIKGAISLPYKEADWKFVDAMAGVPEESAIITYCDGETCELSMELMVFLRNAGYKNIRVLSNGWSVWQQNGLPVETGER
ncbi:MAG: rhodanese-like domain-containing protein, partial [Desulfobacterales bacterium]|nr:rhodanese-like domain-containing protein [Desulfobacterales bacterium]